MTVAARSPQAPQVAAATTSPGTTTPPATVTSPVAPSTSTTESATESATTTGTTETPSTTVPGTTSAPPPSTTEPATSVAPTTVVPAATTRPTPAGTVAEVDGVTLASVPNELILPTSEATLDAHTNPINGRRSLARPTDRQPFGCTVDPDATRPCLLGTLDGLGFDVGGPDEASRARHVRQAVAALQLDAGQRPTGRPDQALYEYLGIWPGTESVGAAEVRRLGTSAKGRPIVARRYGSGPRVVLVVAQTHGDEEAGLRVALRLARQAAPGGVTLWVVPTANPDGLADDSRYLADGTDPNRTSPAHPEQRAVHDFAVAVAPVLAVYYHQNYGWVGGSGASMDPATRYHDLTGLGPLYRSGDCKLGFLWCPIDDAVGSSSILVELPDVVTPAEVRAHADALLVVAAS
jgi:Succinylglutamate desuccinylase / Aspartoacylase family